MKRVVVTGLGLLTSIGNNKIDTWKINSEGIYQEGETEEKI